MSPTRWLRGINLLLAGVAAIAASAAAAQVVDDPCKNHYILSADGKSYENTKCQVAGTFGGDAQVPSTLPPPPGEPPSLRITQVYSSMDGSTQFIELTEYAGRDDQNHVAGMALTSTAHGVTKTFVFPHDLPSSQTAHASFVVGVARDLNGVEGVRVYEFGGCCIAYRDVDFEIPARFVAVDGGTLAFGDDRWDYPALPVSTARALYRDGSIGFPVVENGQEYCSASAGGAQCASNVAISAPLVGAVEFRNVFSDQRYVTADAVAIDTIDRGSSPGWARSGSELGVGETVTTYLGVEYSYVGSPVCRVRVPTSNGGGYFYSVKQDECLAAASVSGAVPETSAAFYAQSADWESGACAPLIGIIDGDLPVTPVYRVSSPLSPFDTRLTTDVTVRDALVAAGWKRSGYGPEGVAMCAY